MNYLLENTVKRKGNIIAHYQQGNILRQVYIYQDKKYIIDSYKPIQKPNFKEIDKGEYKMSKLAQLKAKNAAAQKTVKIEKPETIVKPELTLQGFTMAKEIKAELEAIKAYSIKADNSIKEQSEKLEKVYQFLFNNNNDQIITLLTQLIEQAKTVKPAKQIENVSTDTEQYESNENAFKVFNKYFSGNVTETNFNLAFLRADFSNIETLEESLKKIEKANQDAGHGFLCARKSKKAFIAALWQTFIDTRGGTAKKETASKGNSPVFSLKQFAKNLGIKVDTLNELLTYVDEHEEMTEELENEIYEIVLEENPELEDETAITEFIEFCIERL